MVDILNDLKKIVGERVTVSPFERMGYTSDIVFIPGVVKRRFKTMPSAVVKVNTTEEVCSVLRYCNRNDIPVVARGAGTSALFGAVPKKAGVVLDLRNLSEVTRLDEVEETVTVGAGITWWELDKKLRATGLTLRSYPSSARSATVGGWIMGAGLGIGSLQYGPVFDHLLSGEIVLADGTAKTFTAGAGLEWFAGSEGLMGILASVVLKVRRIPRNNVHRLIRFSDMNELFDFAGALAGMNPRPYAIEIADHSYLSLLRDSGYESVDAGPEGGTALVTYEGESSEVGAGKDAVDCLMSKYQAKEVEGGEREWGHRFNMVRIRRAARSVLPVSVQVPLTHSKQFYKGMRKLRKRPLGLLAYVISGSDCMMMPMVMTDESKPLEYLLALHTPRDICNLAVRAGGKPGGGVGVWNAPYRKQIISALKLDEIRKRKQTLDAKGILNPGMWLDSPWFLQPAAYQSGMAAMSLGDKLIPGSKNTDELSFFRKEIAACSQCGYCANYCPTKQDWVSSTPRGRILTARNWLDDKRRLGENFEGERLQSIFDCTMCGRCRVDCSVDIKSPGLWRDLRSELVKKGFETDALKTLCSTVNQTHNIAAKNNDTRGRWTRKLGSSGGIWGKTRAEVVYYVGCITSFYPMVQDIACSFVQVLNRAEIDFTILGGEEWCCGFPLMSAGHKEDAAVSMRHNIDRIADLGAKTVVMTCPGCYRMWKDEYYEITGAKPPFDVVHSTEYLTRLLEKGKLDLKGYDANVVYHDPCDLGRNSGIFDEPRHIMKSIPGLSLVEFEDNRERCICCGSGGDLLASSQGLALDIARRKLEEVIAVNASSVVTACPSCVRAINMAKVSAKADVGILDITQVVWKAMCDR